MLLLRIVFLPTTNLHSSSGSPTFSRPPPPPAATGAEGLAAASPTMFLCFSCQCPHICPLRSHPGLAGASPTMFLLLFITIFSDSAGRYSETRKKGGLSTGFPPPTTPRHRAHSACQKTQGHFQSSGHALLHTDQKPAGRNTCSLGSWDLQGRLQAVEKKSNQAQYNKPVKHPSTGAICRLVPALSGDQSRLQEETSIK